MLVKSLSLILGHQTVTSKETTPSNKGHKSKVIDNVLLLSPE